MPKVLTRSSACPGSRSGVGDSATRQSRKSSRLTRKSVAIGGVTVVEHQVVAVGIGEEGHVADPGVERLTVELDALGFELRSRRGDVVDVQRRVRVFLWGELHPHFRRFPDPEAGVPRPKLELAALVRSQAKGLDVEATRSLGVR